MISNDKQYLKDAEDFERRYQIAFGKENTRNRQVTTTYTIPVVFHIIHNNGPENITDARVLQGLEHLNQAFAGTGPYTDTLSVDSGIRFCLAQRDEQGNAFTGIVRHQSPYTDMSIAEGFEYIQGLKFNPDQYFNIQIVGNACRGSDCTMAGFAGADRVVIEAQYFGNSVTDDSVIAHEVGHALGLAHTWKGGCKNDDCLSDGDKVCDTPPDNRTYENCFAPFNSCTSDEDDTSALNPFRPVLMGGLGDQPDDHTNFMDYNWWDCARHFTQGQADRMRFVIEKRYTLLLLSDACKPPCDNQVLASFALPDTVVAGTQFTVINLSSYATTYEWYVDGLLKGDSKDLTHTFDKAGIIDVKLVSYSDSDNCRPDSIVKKIHVICPINPCIDYKIQNQFLKFNECVPSSLSIKWEIREGVKLIYSSIKVLDSVYIKPHPFVQLCLEVDNGICTQKKCIFINTTGTNDEICDNEQDDDGDGLIDGFDPDCPCENTAYYNYCKPACEVIPTAFPEIKMKMKWRSEVLENSIFFTSDFQIYSDTNGIIQIISSQMVDRFEMLKYFVDSVKLIKLNALNGEIIQSKIIRNDYIYREFAISDPLRNGIKRFYFTQGDRLVSFDSNLDEIFRSDSLFSNTRTPPSIADINHDGIGEVFQKGIVYNSITGNILLKLPQGACNFGSGSCTSIPVIGDFLSSYGLEIAMGNRVYSVEINNNASSIGNTYKEHLAPSIVTDGFTSTGDIDKDGQLDIVVVTDKNRDGGGIYVWNPRNSSLIASADAGEGGGVAFVGDIDGDCYPEIGMTFKNQLRLYKYDGTTSLKLLWQKQISDNSGRTGVTMFDFNQNGDQELIHRDEDYLRIIEGVSGRTIDSFSVVSPTALEYPVIADIDKDGQAEILITGHENDDIKTRIYCFESATTPWAPARSVWNQYAYNPTFVNDDMTIPRYPQNAAQPLQNYDQCSREVCSTPYNNFMVQATYRTQEGCYVWPELQRDLSITASHTCVGDSVLLCFYATSTDPSIIRQGIPVNCYGSPWSNGTQLMDQIVITSDTTCMMLEGRLGIDSILVVINSTEGTYPPIFPYNNITECNYTNNQFVLPLSGPDFSIDILDWECSPDSLIFYIATDNVGLDTDVSCIG